MRDWTRPAQYVTKSGQAQIFNIQVLSVLWNDNKLKMDSTVKLVITGMSCSSCARTIENAVRALEGIKVMEQARRLLVYSHWIQDISVNVATGSTLVSYDPVLASPDAISEAITDVGFDVTELEVVAPVIATNTENIILQINGMTCTSCVSTIDNILNSHHAIKVTLTNSICARKCSDVSR